MAFPVAARGSIPRAYRVSGRSPVTSNWLATKYPCECLADGLVTSAQRGWGLVTRRMKRASSDSPVTAKVVGTLNRAENECTTFQDVPNSLVMTHTVALRG